MLDIWNYTNMESAVSFHDVCRYYGEVRAVDHVSFEVGDGEFFAMLGPSGSGKTTSLRLIRGRLRLRSATASPARCPPPGGTSAAGSGTRSACGR